MLLIRAELERGPRVRYAEMAFAPDHARTRRLVREIAHLAVVVLRLVDLNR